MRTLLKILIGVFCVAGSLLLNQPLAHTENKAAQYRLLYTLRIDNSKNGAVAVQNVGSELWETIGQVVSPVRGVNLRGFSASRWAKPGTVAASAVNAIHIGLGAHAREARGVVFSIIPEDELKQTQATAFNRLASVVVNIHPGTKIFGGHYAPFAGNPVRILRDQVLVTVDATLEPRNGDQIFIDVRIPDPFPEWISFQNKFGGVIKVKFPEASTAITIGQVLRPAVGVGRFKGTEYSSRGRIRAVHPGVIDVDCSWLGDIGGFQIIPAEHAMDPEMVRAKTMSQWMVVGPVKLGDTDLAGQAPLFLDYLAPRYDQSDLQFKNWPYRLLERFQVVGRQNNDPDHVAMLPEKNYPLDLPLPKEALTDLNDYNELTIYFPIFNRSGTVVVAGGE